jgi:hypothetical protein
VKAALRLFPKASMPFFCSWVATNAWNSRHSNITPLDRPLSKTRLLDKIYQDLNH